MEYELLRELFLLLKVINTPLKHWLYSSDSHIAEAMHDVVLSKTLFMISEVNFIVVNANEMNTFDVQQWISIHGCVMQKWKHVFILLTIEKVEVGATSDNIKGVILDMIGRYKGLTNFNMATKWICLGCNSDSIFQSIESRVITQTKEQIAPFFIVVYYVAH